MLYALKLRDNIGEGYLTVWRELAYSIKSRRRFGGLITIHLKGGRLSAVCIPPKPAPSDWVSCIKNYDKLKLSNLVLVFMGIAMGFFVVSFMSIDIVAQRNIDNTEISNKLTSACYDAAQSMDEMNIEKYGCVWHDDADLEKTLDVFYTSLAYSFNRENTGKMPVDELALYTPVVVLVDVNGYYISHNIVFDETGMVNMPDADEESGIPYKYTTDKKTGLTGLNTWSKPLGDNKVIRFFLNDNVEIYMTNGTVYKGNRKKVYEKIGQDNPDSNVPEDLEFLKVDEGEDSFNNVRNKLIISEIREQCEYYINKHNIIGNRDDEIQYAFEMPELEGEQWNRMLQNPTVISFLQGYWTRVKGKLINTYALAAGELINNYHYFITKVENGGEVWYEYHCIETEPDCKLEHDADRTVKNEVNGKETTISNEYYTYKGEKIDEIYYSQTDCARKGAIPHDCVY